MITSNRFMGNNPSGTRRRRFKASDYGNREYIKTVFDKRLADVNNESTGPFKPFNTGAGNIIPEITRHDRIIKNVNKSYKKMSTRRKNQLYNRPDIGPRLDAYSVMKMDKLSVMPLNTRNLLIQSQNTAFKEKNKYYTGKTLEEKKSTKLLETISGKKTIPGSSSMDTEVAYFVKLRSGLSGPEFEEMLRSSPSLFARFSALSEGKKRAILHGF